MTRELTLHRAQMIYGWMSDAELLFLAERASKSKIVFEIGSYLGRSTRAMGDNTDGTIYAIDPWQAINYDSNETHVIFVTDESVYNMFYCNNYDLIKKGKIIPCRSIWGDWRPPRLADFIFIDGDHRYDEVKFDIYKALALIRSGGIIAGHDYAPPWHGVIKAVNEYFGSINLVDSIWWVQR